MQLPGLAIGIVADDLTGANDTALQFFQAGCPTRILLDLVQLPETEGVLSINTESRHLDPREAVARVRRAVALLRDHYGVENFYKKIDSTLRGHIAQECLAVLDELKGDCVVIVPAYPDESRRTVGGYQLVHGIPVEKTEVARDPLFPVRESHIPRLLMQATKPEIVGHIELSTVMRGAGPVLLALNEQIKQGKKLVVADACSMTDLEQIALAIEKVQNSARVIPCGSAGMAQALTRFWANMPEKSDGVPSPDKLPLMPASPILMMCGTNSSTTRNQLMQLKENYSYYGEGSQLEMIELSPEQILRLQPVEQEVAMIIERLESRNTVVVSISLSENNYNQTMELAEAHQIPTHDVALRGQEILASITRQVLEQKKVKLILSGGETSNHICKVLNANHLQMVGRVEPSIPLLRDDQGRWIITKSGNFGTPLALANIVKYLKHHESSSLHV